MTVVQSFIKSYFGVFCFFRPEDIRRDLLHLNWKHCLSQVLIPWADQLKLSCLTWLWMRGTFPMSQPKSLKLSVNAHLGQRFSFFRILRWKREGAKHTAIFMGVIWFSCTEEVTSLRKHSKVCRTSLFSSDISMMAAWTACNRWSLGTSTKIYRKQKVSEI